MRTRPEGTIIVGVSAALTSDPNVQGAAELGLVPCDASGSGFSVSTGIDTPLRQGDPATLQVQLCGAAYELNSTAGEAGFAVWIGLNNVADSEGHWPRSLTAWLGNDWGPDFSGTFLDVGPNDLVLPDDENGWASVLVHSMGPQFEKTWNIGFIAGPYEVDGLVPGTYDSEMIVELWAVDANQFPGKIRRIAAASSPLLIYVPGEPRVEMEAIGASNNTWYISSAPAMPEIQLRARLLDAPEPDEVTVFDWTFTVAHALSNNRCIPGGRTGSVVVSGRSSAIGEGWSDWTVPFLADSAAVSYSGISGAGGTTVGCAYEFTAWSGVNGWTGAYQELNPNTDFSLSAPFVGTGKYTNGETTEIWAGGDVAMEVTGTAGANTYPTAMLEGYSLRSQYPDETTVQATIDAEITSITSVFPDLQNPSSLAGTDMQREMRAVAIHESSNRQFNAAASATTCVSSSRTGLPCWGYPNGYGVTQLDFPPTTELQLWNWRANIEGGTTHYLKNRRRFISDVEATGVFNASSTCANDGGGGKQTVTQQEFVFKGAYAKYNGGIDREYWRYNNLNSCWGRIGSQAATNADEAWRDF